MVNGSFGGLRHNNPRDLTKEINHQQKHPVSTQNSIDYTNSDHSNIMFKDEVACITVCTLKTCELRYWVVN